MFLILQLLRVDSNESMRNIRMQLGICLSTYEELMIYRGNQLYVHEYTVASFHADKDDGKSHTCYVFSLKIVHSARKVRRNGSLAQEIYF